MIADDLELSTLGDHRENFSKAIAESITCSYFHGLGHNQSHNTKQLQHYNLLKKIVLVLFFSFGNKELSGPLFQSHLDPKEPP